MNNEGAILAFDFGASSGRCIAGRILPSGIETTVVHRFPNRPIISNGRFQWDIQGLFAEILEGLIRYRRDHNGKILSLGIDTWGVDYGLLRGSGRLLANPYHYRDSRTDDTPEHLFTILPQRELYAGTGIQMMSINTVFQLFAERNEDPELFGLADTLLMTPDLLGYFLTGVRRSEISISSTSSLLDPRTMDWNREIIGKLGYPQDIFAPVIRPGEQLGPINEDVERFTGLKGTPVMTTTSHDTQSAIAAVPAVDEDFIYLSSGTWSLMGIESQGPVLSERSEELGFTNEIGADDKISLLTNIMGLWLLQECKRIWDREGHQLDYDTLVSGATAEKPLQAFVNPMDPRYAAPENMPEAIREGCREAGFAPPQSESALARVIFESLALVYRRTVERITELTGRRRGRLHIVGGGVQNRLLCQMAADATGLEVIAGPVEATALGNIIVQAKGRGQIGSIAEGRQLIAATVEPERYYPSNNEAWEKAYRRFIELYPD